MRKIVATIIALAIGGTASIAIAQDDAESLDELLNQVRQGKVSETEEHRQREAEFRQQRDRQEQLLQQARQEKAAEERRSDQLERTIQQNEQELAQLEQTLQERLGELQELFGVIQQVAGDARATITGSNVSVQYGVAERLEGINILIDKASRSSTLPSIEEIEVLWEQMMLEMTESGKVVQFQHPVISAEGEQTTVDLIRVGDFNLVGNGLYYNFRPETGKVVELQRQPAGRFLSTAGNLTDAAESDTVAFGIDPSRGQILDLLIQAPSLRERIDQGREIGYLIIALGVIGVLLAIERFIYLSIVNSKVRKQIRSETPSAKNPLGRVLQVYDEYKDRDIDVETLELKLDEAILKETPALERFLTFLKIISAVAPLFGLLGTVTGMIATFQAITLFGTGDPTVMANGISQALVTTVLGLTVAIPTLLLHSLVSGMSRRVIHVLEEQSAGIIAVYAEKENAGAASA